MSLTAPPPSKAIGKLTPPCLWHDFAGQAVRGLRAVGGLMFVWLLVRRDIATVALHVLLGVSQEFAPGNAAVTAFASLRATSQKQ